MAKSSFFSKDGIDYDTESTYQEVVDKAKQHAEEAAASAASAAEFLSLSQVAQTASETARLGAEAARDDAVQARVLAEAAQVAAENFRDAAEGFRDDAFDFKEAAESALANAELAKTAAENAKQVAEDAALDAQDSADQAAASALAASNSAAVVANALDKTKNLSDLTNVDTARTNLGLGTGNTPTFAGVNVTNNASVGGSISVSGPLTIAGWNALSSFAADAGTTPDLDTITTPGIYGITSGVNAPGSTNGILIVMRRGGSSVIWQWFLDMANPPVVWIRRSSWSAWQRVITDGVASQTITGPLTIQGNDLDPGLTIKATGTSGDIDAVIAVDCADTGEAYFEMRKNGTRIGYVGFVNGVGPLRIINDIDGSYLTLASDGINVNGGLVCPPGLVAAFAMNTAPAGWLKCNGAAVSRTTYANLFAAIGTTFGAGNGSTTFNVPDLRGEFVRGWADNRNVDAGRVFGSFQADEFKAHGGHVTAVENDGVAGSNDTNSTGNVALGGTETRPRNIALLYCIKF